MLFNSLEFAVFFAIVHILYLLLRHKWQNRMLLLASYVFYGSWDWRFLSLILISTIIDYFCGLAIHRAKEEKQRKLPLIVSIASHLWILGFFKYFNFFASNLELLLSALGFSVHAHFLDIVLPVGISFYTFQTMSYTIDIYRREMEPTESFLDFALFVAFFPQLVAGPIERAKRLLPQILTERVITRGSLSAGFYLIFWGLFQKVVVADNLSRMVDPVFGNGSYSTTYSGWEVLLAVYAFAFQIYCDFAGYSNIARGLGSCLGFRIMVNFRSPYVSRNPREFWRRWHISLSTFLRDYLYIPLGGDRKGRSRTYLNLAITMVLGGLWHGAAWPFVLWGAYHGALLILYRLTAPIGQAIRNGIPLPGKIVKGIQIAVFFHLVCLGWLIFRAQSMGQLLAMAASLGTIPAGIQAAITGNVGKDLLFLLFLISPIVAYHFLKGTQKEEEGMRGWHPGRRTAFILGLAYMCLYIVILGKGSLVGGGREFIYFQF